MPYGDGMSYLPALSRLMGEVEQPTQNGQMTSPQFGGSSEQLSSILQSPHMQQQLAQWGIHYDPQQVRQSPFFPNSFMQQHPQMGRMLSGGMANAAMTPEAPMVSGAGSGISRAFQGMMGGPEMQRQYQVKQMLAPMQAAGMQMPMQEFERKQQLMQLLQKMEQDRQGLAQGAQNFNQSKPQRIGNIGMMNPTDPQLAGQPQGIGASQPPFKLFQNQGQQQIPSWSFSPFDPGMLGAQANAQHPERGATANLKGAQADEQRGETKAGMPGAKVDNQRAGATQKRAAAGLAGARTNDVNKKAGGKAVDPIKISKQYNDAEKQYRDQMAGLDAALKGGKLTQEQYDNNRTQALAALQTSKGNIDQAQGNPGASSRGQQQMQGGGQPPQQQENLSQHPELQGQPPGRYKDNQTGGIIVWDGKNAKPEQPQQPQQ